jgi:glycolate oxidase iron-sulfur subunit
LLSHHAMRTELSTYLEELSKCVRCGSCKASCPTFGDDPLEPMGTRGRLILLRGLIKGEIKPSALLNERIFSCILCGACEGTCPLGVDIPETIYRGRAFLRASDKKRRFLRSIVKISTKWPDQAFGMLRFGERLILPFLARKGIIPFSPELPEVPFRKSEQVFKAHKKKGRVAIFAGCSTNYLFPHFGESLINVLQKFGYEAVLPKGETCCGAPLRALGLEREAEELAKKNYRVLSRLKVDAILSPCPTCTMYLRNEYPKTIGKGLERAMDISVFFREKLKPLDKIYRTSFYHDPCHLYYGLGVKDEPREIIRKSGLELADHEEPGCCGFGGLYCLSFKETSSSLLNKRKDRITESNADMVISSCPGCVLQLGRAITDRPVLHLIELIEEAYCYRTAEKSGKEKNDPEKEPTLF